MSLPKQIKIVEVGPRDGLQNEQKVIPLDGKIKLINLLSESGISTIETGSFVSPKWVPQMAQTPEVFRGITRRPGVCYSALTPNLKGLHNALAADVHEVAVFAATSETFSRKNINCTIQESIKNFSKVCTEAQSYGLRTRGYLSCVFGCPYEGNVSKETVFELVSKLIEIGCYEISLGDTIGVATPIKARDLINHLKTHIPIENLAVHFHDTYGQALPNILAVIQQGISCVDSAVAGLGGCPYAKGATGNVATEDVLYMLEGMGIATSINIDKVLKASWFISNLLGRKPMSKVANAFLGSNS